jgi:hypothetical protein
MGRDDRGRRFRGTQVPGQDPPQRVPPFGPRFVGLAPFGRIDPEQVVQAVTVRAGDSSRLTSTSSSSASAALASGGPNSAAAAGRLMAGPDHRPSSRNALAGSMAAWLAGPGRLA